MGREAGGKECEELSLCGKFLCFDICQHVTHFCGKASQEQFVIVLFIGFFFSECLCVDLFFCFCLYFISLVLCAVEHSHAHKCRYKFFIEL